MTMNLLRLATAVTHARVIMNAFKTDEQRKAYWAGKAGGGAKRASTPAEIPLTDTGKEMRDRVAASRAWEKQNKAAFLARKAVKDKATAAEQNDNIEAARLRIGRNRLDAESSASSKTAWAAYRRQLQAGNDAGAQRMKERANAIESRRGAETSLQQRFAEARRIADAIHSNAWASPSGNRYKATMTNRAPMTDAQRRGMFAARARGGNNVAAPRGAPVIQLARDGNNIAPPRGAPTTITSVITGPNSTIHRTVETGFPRAPTQSGAVNGPVPDQLRKPRPADQFGPGDQGHRKIGTPTPPYPVQHPDETTREYYQRAAEWEKKYSPDHALRPWGGGGAPGAPSARDADSTRKMADQLKKKAAKTRTVATSKLKYPTASIDTDRARASKSQPVLSDAARGFAGIPISFGRR